VIKLRTKNPNYEKAILGFLAKTRQPLDVEKIRVGCGIGHWQTALKHCLELKCEGKIQGTKTSKSWVFWLDPLGLMPNWPEEGGLRNDR